MNNGMGFCFPNPTSPESGSLPRSILATKRRRVNSWPELVGSLDPYIPRSNPLINAWYIGAFSLERLTGNEPTKFPFLVRSDDNLSDLPLQLATTHEYVHLLLNFTPVKDRARLVLAEAYAAVHLLWSVDDLTSEETDILNNVLRTANDTLSGLGQDIAMVEELLATSYAFQLNYGAMSRIARSRSSLEALIERVFVGELDAAHKQAIWFGDDFLQLYFGDGALDGFRKIAWLMASDGPESKRRLFPRLAIFLQGLTSAGEYGWAVDGSVRCAELVGVARGIDRADQLTEWLDEKIASNHELQNWTRVLTKIVETCSKEQPSGSVESFFGKVLADRLSLLWEMTVGRGVFVSGQPDQLVANLQAECLRWPNSALTLNNSLYIYWEKVAGAWTVHVETNPTDDHRLSSLARDEEWREQIDSGGPLLCARTRFHPRECRCLGDEALLGEILQRLATRTATTRVGRAPKGMASGPCDQGR